MNRLPDLNDRDFHGVLLNALQCAAEKYRDNAKIIRAESEKFPAMKATHDGLAAQFDRQAAEAVMLAERLEEEAADVA